MPRPAGGVSQAAAAGGPAWARPDDELDGVAPIAAAEKQSSAEGVNGEVTSPAMLRPELGAQSTHHFTLKLTEPLT